MLYTNDQILNEFDKAITCISEFISRLDDFKTRFEYISDQTTDNADPEIEASECLEKLGVLLATLNIYRKEYADEPIDEQTGKIIRK